MYKIGIIGSDNSHAEIFSKMVNLPNAKTGEYAFPDFKVTGIFGLDKARTEQVAHDGNIETIVESPDRFMGSVDAVMVVFRHGDLHLKYAMPFVKAGVPTWVDKPFTINNDDARSLIEEAEKRGTLLTGGSTCRHTPDIAALKFLTENGARTGRLKTAVMNFPATLENEYGGIYFYGAHLAEMAMTAFGFDAISVLAAQNNGIVTAIVKYERFTVTLNFIPGATEYFALVHGEKGTSYREIDITNCYRFGFADFAGMLRTGKLPMPLEHLYKPVALLNAIVKSYTEGVEITL